MSGPVARSTTGDLILLHQVMHEPHMAGMPTEASPPSRTDRLQRPSTFSLCLLRSGNKKHRCRI
jgi:hypothetical protein